MTDPARPGIIISVRDTAGAEHRVTLPGDQDRYLIGRSDPNIASVVDVALADRHVSRRHCAIVWDDRSRAWTVIDSKSSNGTTLDGQPVGDAPLPLSGGSRVKVGATMLTFDFPHGEPTAVVAAPDTPTALLPGGTIGDAATLLVQDGDGRTRLLPDADQAATIVEPQSPSVPQAEAKSRTAPHPQPGKDASSPKSGTNSGILRSLVRILADTGDRTVQAADAARVPASAPTLPQTSPSVVEPPPGDGGPAPEPYRTEPEPSTLWDAEAAAQTAQAERRQDLPRRHPEIILVGIARTLVDANLVDGAKAAALCRIARETGRTFFRALAEDGGNRFEDEIYERVARERSLETIANERALMERAMPTTWLPFTLATKRGAVMLTSGEDKLCYATIDPFDLMLDDWIARCAGGPAKRLLVTPTAFFSALQRLKNQGEEDENGGNVLVIDISPDDEQRISMQMEDADVPQIVNYFLQRAFVQGASDIHVEPMEDYLLVRNRVDGILHEDTSLPVAMHPEIASRVKIIAGMDVAEKRRPQDGRISSLIQGNAIDVRVSSYPTIYGEKMVMRLLDKNALRPSPEHLGMLARDLRLLQDKLNAPFGLVMISGPTGSGKTTTLYSCLGSIDKKSKNVLTVEDPVEYRLKGVHQMQVNDRIGLTFASGMRTILRQDPDVIMVGECRDTETAGMAIQAALTGHIVFSTIHTNDAVGVITRLLDMGIDPFLVSNALTLTIAQRLVRKVCKHCQTTLTGAQVRRQLFDDGVSDERLAALGIDIDDALTYVQGLGCVHCRNTGYHGRQAVFEVFEMSNAARNMIMSPGFNADELRRMAQHSGMTTLISHGLQLIEEGITTHSEAIRVLGETY